LTTVRNINNWNTWNTKQKTNCNSCNVIYRIHKLAMAKNINLKITHIYSHLADSHTTMKDEEVVRKMEKIRDTYGDFMYKAIIGNDKVDKLTKATTIKVEIPKWPETYQRFVITVNGIPVDNSRKTLMQICKKQNEKGMSTRCQGKTMKAILSWDADQENSLWPLNANGYHKKLTSFKHNMLTGLPTRNSMMKRKMGMIQHLMRNKTAKWVKHFEIKYSEEWCTRCDTEVEDTDYIFSCKTSKDIWSKTKQEIIQEVCKVKKVKTLPWWFGDDTDRYPAYTDNSGKLEKFNKNWGNRAIIPAVLGDFLHGDLGFKASEAAHTLKQIAKLMTIMAFKIWIERNKSLEEWTNAEEKRIETERKRKKPFRHTATNSKHTEKEPAKKKQRTITEFFKSKKRNMETNEETEQNRKKQKTGN
jgi:hypothetical protein